MKQIEILSMGQDVIIDTMSQNEEVTAKIVGVYIKSSGHVDYEVVYWKDKHRITTIVDECEIKVKGKTKEKTKIGF